MNIKDSIKKALQRKGFFKASEIQEKVIPAALLGKDVVGKSRTGTGKTAAFAIPLVQKIIPGQGFSAIVIVPTRELASQVKEEIASIASGSHVKTLAVFGGQNIRRQMDFLEREPEIIVGTPGRLIDLLSRGALSLKRSRFLVLDEADKMFDMGFRDDVERIISVLPRERQTMLFSATMPREILGMFDMGFRDDVERIISVLPRERQTMLFSATMPREILGMIDRHMSRNKEIFDLSEDDAPVQEVQQFYLMADRHQKIDSLRKVLVAYKSKTLVFCRTKRTVDWLERQLSNRGIRALAIHGDKPQNARNRIIDRFKSSSGGVLIATDIVARGIHVDDIGNVINFDFPQETEAYIHRIGRTARQGKQGMAVSLCSNLMELETLKRVGARNNAVIQPFQG